MADTDAEEYALPVLVFTDFELAWQVFLQLEAVEWKHLPYPGSLLDQPDGLMADVAKIRAAVYRVRKQLRDQSASETGDEATLSKQLTRLPT